MRVPFYVIVATGIMLPGPSGAVELHHVDVRKGTEGLRFAPISVSNSGPDILACNADLAHWYSQSLGAVAPGTTFVIPLWLDPSDGTYTLLNDKDENMPVEALWCGVAGRAYETRARLKLDRAADGGETRIIACETGSGRAVCG